MLEDMRACEMYALYCIPRVIVIILWLYALKVKMSKSPAVAALLPGYSNTLSDPESKELKYCDKLKLVNGTDLMKFL